MVGREIQGKRDTERERYYTDRGGEWEVGSIDSCISDRILVERERERTL